MYTTEQALAHWLNSEHEYDGKETDWIYCSECGGQICQENDEQDYSEYDDYNELDGKIYCFYCYEEKINETNN